MAEIIWFSYEKEGRTYPILSKAIVTIFLFILDSENEQGKNRALKNLSIVLKRTSY